MQSPAWYLNRLKRMDLAEVLWRARSLLRDGQDVMRISFGWSPKEQPPVSWRSLSPGFHVTPATPAELPAQQLEQLRHTADQICDHRLDLFNLHGVNLGTPINWHRDWHQQLDTPIGLSAFIDYRDAPKSGDCKQVWEPNRHHQFVVLARAYHWTGESKYAEAMLAQMDEWIAANPFGHGMNWRSPLELAVRMINWVWALDLVRNVDIDDDRWQRIYTCLAQHLWDLGRKFSSGSSANNHLIGEAAGVFVVASYLPQLPQAKELQARTWQILCDEILQQFHADGCTAEQAFGYQFFTLQFFTIGRLVARASNLIIPDTFDERLLAAYQFLERFAEAGDELPMFGDKDDGYVLNLGDPSHDASAMADVCRSLFTAAHSSTETAYWLTGKPYASSTLSPDKPLASHAFAEGGHYLLQCGQGSERLSLHVDCAPLGYGAIAAHGHADALAITLRVGGLAFLVDPGTFDYFTFPEWREAFKRTINHNTVCVDGQDQSERLGPFMWGQQAQSRCKHWSDSAENTEFVGCHDGYQRLQDPVDVWRKCRLDKARGHIEIEDELRCSRAHLYQAAFHLHPDCTVQRLDDRFIIQRADQILELIVPSDCQVRIYSGDEEHKLGWFSAGYHQKQPSPTLVVEKQLNGSAKIRYELNAVSVASAPSLSSVSATS